MSSSGSRRHFARKAAPKQRAAVETEVELDVRMESRKGEATPTSGTDAKQYPNERDLMVNRPLFTRPIDP
mgnify:CR=1 FL=1